MKTCKASWGTHNESVKHRNWYLYSTNRKRLHLIVVPLLLAVVVVVVVFYFYVTA